MKKRKIRRRNSKKSYLTLPILLVILIILLIILSNSFKKQIIINPIAVGKSVNSDKIEEMLTNKSISYTSIDKSNRQFFIISLKDNGQVVVSNQKNLSDQLASLQVILNRLTIEGKRFRSLDFRYDKPVISY